MRRPVLSQPGRFAFRGARTCRTRSTEVRSFADMNVPVRPPARQNDMCTFWVEFRQLTTDTIPPNMCAYVFGG